MASAARAPYPAERACTDGAALMTLKKDNARTPQEDALGTKTRRCGISAEGLRRGGNRLMPCMLWVSYVVSLPLLQQPIVEVRQ